MATIETPPWNHHNHPGDPLSQQKNALVIVMSDISNDPRVRREIDWLGESGWLVDTLGLGEKPSDSVRQHFALTDQTKWVQSRLGAAIVYFLLPNRLRFRLLTGNRIPAKLAQQVSSGQYSLIIFNDREFIPWVKDHHVFSASARQAHIHLDLHEYFVSRLERDSLWNIATNGYHKWVRRVIPDPVFTTRSTVARGIAELYAEEFDIPPLAVIRNSPPFVDQSPGPVDPHSIKLIHHGLASWDRGLREIVDAMRQVDDRFSMTFMLANNNTVIAELAEYASDLGGRVRIVPPVPMRELSTVVNQFDMEIMFYRPSTRNLQFALPNKLFEAVQGRLGLIIGESPMMIDIVEEHANGVIVRGWTPAALAAALNGLTTDQIAGFKAASHRAARSLSAEAERSVFLESIGAGQQPFTESP